MFIARVYLNRYSLKLVGASRMRKIIFYYYLFIQSTQQFERKVWYFLNKVVQNKN